MARPASSGRLGRARSRCEMASSSVGLARGRRPARFDAALELGGEDGAEHPVRFGVLRIDGQRLAGGAGGVLGAVGAGVEGGDLGGNGRALRVGLGGQPIRFERLRDLAEGFEVSAANELEVGCGRRGLRRPDCAPAGCGAPRVATEGRQEHSAAPRVMKSNCSMRRACSQGRAHQPGALRAMKILLVRLRLIGDVVFTTPAVTAIRDAFPEARDHLSGGAGGRAGRPGPSRHRRRARWCRTCAAGGGSPPTWRSPASCAAPASTWSSTSTAARARRS